MAEAVKEGISSAGGSVTIYQLVSLMCPPARTSLTDSSRIEETLSPDILKRMHAPPRLSYPILLPNDLVNFDAFLFGIPTRFGNFPAQWKAFWDATGSLWTKGALAGKMCGVFVSTDVQGGGQEETFVNSLSTFVHHGMIYVPLGYQNTFAQITNVTEIHGGAYFHRCPDIHADSYFILSWGGHTASPWGAGAFAGADGSRQPSALELEMATIQGKSFWEVVSRHKGFPA